MIYQRRTITFVHIVIHRTLDPSKFLSLALQIPGLSSIHARLCDPFLSSLSTSNVCHTSLGPTIASSHMTWDLATPMNSINACPRVHCARYATSGSSSEQSSADTHVRSRDTVLPQTVLTRFTHHSNTRAYATWRMDHDSCPAPSSKSYPDSLYDALYPFRASSCHGGRAARS